MCDNNIPTFEQWRKEHHPELTDFPDGECIDTDFDDEPDLDENLPIITSVTNTPTETSSEPFSLPFSANLEETPSERSARLTVAAMASNYRTEEKGTWEDDDTGFELTDAGMSQSPYPDAETFEFDDEFYGDGLCAGDCEDNLDEPLDGFEHIPF